MVPSSNLSVLSCVCPSPPPPPGVIPPGTYFLCRNAAQLKPWDSSAFLLHEESCFLHSVPCCLGLFHHFCTRHALLVLPGWSDSDITLSGPGVQTPLLSLDISFVSASNVLFAGSDAFLFLLRGSTCFRSFMEQGCMGSKIFLNFESENAFYFTFRLT